MSFQPHFTITAALLGRVEGIAALRERIQNATVQVPWIPALQKDTRARNTHSSTAIEGNPLTLVGDEVKVGSPAPDFDLVCFENGGMQHIRKADLAGKPAFISVVPSLDTPVCQVQTKKFNERLAAMGDKINALTVSLDLPFAMKRFCGAESITGMKVGSDYKDREFGKAFGVLIDELKLLARSVFVLDSKGNVTYAELVKEVASEPNYDAALAALQSAG